jgi:signal transduction histidine kinase
VTAGVVRLLGVGVLQGDDARLHLRHEVNVRRVPRRGVGVFDSLDSRRGAASCLAMVAPPPPLSAGKVTGRTRMLFFRHAGKTALIPPPAGGLTAAIVAVALRRKDYHVVVAVEGHELKTPETELRPELERLLETTHPELDRKLFVNTQQALPGAPTVGVSTAGGPWTDE